MDPGAGHGGEEVREDGQGVGDAGGSVEPEEGRREEPEPGAEGGEG